MSTPPLDPIAFKHNITAAFPSARLESHPIDFGEIHLRFELGDDHANGSDKRIAQTTERAVSLFEQCNSRDDHVVVIINDFDVSGREVLPTEPPDYLNSLLPGLESDACVQMIDTEGAEAECAYRQLLFRTTVQQVDYDHILRGIAHLEQGRTPRINASVYFVNERNNTVFYMYDDRGCLIYSNRPEALKKLYVKHNDWLVDFHRSHFDAIWADS